MVELASLFANFLCETEPTALPPRVRHEGERALLNWFGCALGGCRADLIDRALAVADRLSGPREASVLGRGMRLDPANAAFINCYSSSLNAFDDTHLVSITHPTGPVAAGALAVAEGSATSGSDFLLALILGLELECRMACVLAEPPGDCGVLWTMTGLVGGIGGAAAVGKIIGLDRARMTAALGIAATQAAGYREGFGTMMRDFPMAQAARSGVIGALLAAEGFTSSPSALDGPRGFAHVFARTPNLPAATRGLGQHFEMLNNSYKPCPCGIVIHPAIDACLEITRNHQFRAEDIEEVSVRVHHDALAVTGLKVPRDGLSAQVSVYHWIAATLLRRRAGLDEATDAAARDPAIAAIRDRVKVETDPQFGRDGASAEVRLADGRRLSATIEHCRGSLAKPLTDKELEAKLLMQAEDVIPNAAARELIDLCWGISDVKNIGDETRRIFQAAS